jgi:uncharacterized protein YggE
MKSRLLNVLGIVAVCASVTWGPYALAQETSVHPANVISIDATGSAKGTPDILKIRLPASTTTPLAADAVAQTKKKIDDLIAQLIAVNVPKETIERSGISVSAGQDKYRSDAPAGLTASEMITITLKGQAMAQAPERVSSIMDAASRTGVLSCRNTGDSPFAPWDPRADSANFISFTVSDPEALRAAALQDAVANARKIAESLAKTLGVKIERVRSVDARDNTDFGLHMPGWGDKDISSASPTTLSVSVSATVAFDFSR